MTAAVPEANDSFNEPFSEFLITSSIDIGLSTTFVPDIWPA
jgi:hypothetical protein